jgi:4-alpha-glucanotransferase
VVVGEDLGTVENWVRDYLRERGLLGTSILWFEHDRWRDGAPLEAQWWREYCLSSVTTHDLPPTAGYLAGEHVRIRQELGLLARPAEEELADDQAEQAAWFAELRRVGLLGQDPTVDDVVVALYEYLGRTPSRLLALALPDAVGDVRTQNQPGTSDEYPNWRVPLANPDGRQMSVEDVFEDARAAVLAQVMRAAGHDRSFSEGGFALCSHSTVAPYRYTRRSREEARPAGGHRCRCCIGDRAEHRRCHLRPG